MRTLVVLALLVVAAISCGTSPSSTSQTRPRSTARLVIIEPRSGATVDHNHVEVKLRLDGGRITKVVTTHIRPNVGHIHLRVDGVTVTLLGSLDQVIRVKPGQHVLEAEFVAADHGPFVPDVVEAVTFYAR